MARYTAAVPWFVSAIATIAALGFGVQSRNARTENETLKASIAAERKATESQASAIIADAKHEAERLKREASLEWDRAKAAAIETQARDLTKYMPGLRLLTGDTIVPLNENGQPHPFVERIDRDKSITYYNTTSKPVQPVISVQFFNAAGVAISSMYDSWSWSSVGPGERRIEEKRATPSYGIVGNPGQPVYYKVTIENNSEKQ